ncbi:MAG: hypothetical protein FJ044_00870 [Candidatus Cloacimonetes bacterium]|nr:hypothetical protein [Candidatus Cloacimonadota bacterium]
MNNENRLKQLKDLIERSELPESQKTFWLEKLPLLPEVLLNRLQIMLSRIEILQLQKKVLNTLSSLPPEKMFDSMEQEKALLELRKNELKKSELRKAAEIAAELNV